MHDSVVMAWLGMALVVAGSVVGAMLLRTARCPGWAVIGGVCAGIVLGPTIFGRVMPSAFEQMYVGGRAEQRDIEAARELAEHVPPSDDEPTDAAAPLEELETARDEARWSHQQPMRTTAMIIVGLVLLGSAAGPRGAKTAKPQPVQFLTIGGWSALLPGGIAFVVLHLLLDVDRAAALLAASAVAIGPWQFTNSDIEAADRAEIGGAQLMHRSGIAAGVVALVVAWFAAWQMRGIDGLLMTAPLGALVISWFLPAIDARSVDSLIHFALLPTLAALAAMKVELLIHFAIWPVLLFALLSGDGRWLGALIGALLLGGRKSLRTMRLVIGVMACGPTQLAIAAIAGHGELLEGPLLLAIVFGAVLVELFTPARRALAERIAETERELDEMMDE